MFSDYGCATFESDEFWIFITDYRIAFGTIFVIFGTICNFYGKVALQFLVAIAGLMVGIFCCLILYFVVWYDTSLLKPWAFWVCFSFGVLVGGAAGYFMAMSKKLAKAFVSGYMGFCLALMLNFLCLYILASETIFWVVNTVFVIVFTIFGAKCRQKHMIWVTAIDGSYIVSRGIALLSGHYQNEYDLINLMKIGAITKREWYVYGYFLVFLILLIMGIWF
mmetsp:Transcript_4981/g.3423  ORF Transcript_4981/g.3423 Transcript_4981/m.3423 type:complete len:221 (+) Transcript_4981:519-1181(+)